MSTKHAEIYWICENENGQVPVLVSGVRTCGVKGRYMQTTEVAATELICSITVVICSDLY